MGNVYDGFSLDLLTPLSYLVSGGASNATFAVVGLLTTDLVLAALIFNGATAVLKSVEVPSTILVAADGQANTSATATNADTVCLLTLRAAAA